MPQRDTNGRFRFIEHTADVRVECRAETFPALLETAAKALYAVALARVHSKTGSVRRITLAADAQEVLLVRWLQELIFLLETNSFVGVDFDIHAVNGRRIEAVVGGYVCRPNDRAGEVKAATYHELEIATDTEGYIARVVFDV